MNSQSFHYLANAVLLAHVGVVLFIVAGLAVILVGGHRGWRWVRNFWFRAAHLAAIVYVALQSWLDVVCPLTTLELWLRVRGGQLVYEGDFIAYWLGRLLFYAAPPWAFIAAYTAFALLVGYSWVSVRPVPWKRQKRAD